MNQDSVLRKQLIMLLKGGEAHLPVKNILEGVNPGIINKRPHEDGKSIWEELEHLRLSQKDILDYIEKIDYRSMNWPEDYWPKNSEAGEEEWESFKNKFLDDLDKVVKLVDDENFDLFGTVPQNQNHTNLREVFLIADHNAYHLSKIVQIRKYFGDWK